MTLSTTEQATHFAGWDGKGVLAQAPTPARPLFEEANALFGVQKRELRFPTEVDHPADDYLAGHGSVEYTPSGVFGLVRTDTQALLGVVTKQYEIVQNENLLRMAEFIREEVEMDSVVVLSGGQKVAFTANVRGASADIVPGDTIKRRFVGYLGHDGKTGCGAMFTNIRVVCSNTLASARKDASSKVSIRHKGGANDNFDQLIQSIDVARQDFITECDLMREFTKQSMNRTQFNDFIDELYSVEEGDAFRKRSQLESAFIHGLGWHYAPESLWSAVNAVTQVETSTKQLTAKSAVKKFHRANFGQGLALSQQAIALASSML